MRCAMVWSIEAVYSRTVVAVNQAAADVIEVRAFPRALKPGLLGLDAIA